jgi:hypothetical protein
MDCSLLVRDTRTSHFVKIINQGMRPAMPAKSDRMWLEKREHMLAEAYESMRSG